MKQFLKDWWLAVVMLLSLTTTGIYRLWTRPKLFAAICNGQQYQFNAPRYTLSSGGCVTFQGVGFVCGCNLVVEVKEEAKK
jgi:hypothetical protein